MAEGILEYPGIIKGCESVEEKQMVRTKMGLLLREAEITTYILCLV